LRKKLHKDKCKNKNAALMHKYIEKNTYSTYLGYRSKFGKIKKSGISKYAEKSGYGY
jgi:hypothetical protein